MGSPDYSRLTVNLFCRADCEMLEPVPASRFEPRPAPFDVLDEATFFRVTEACFNRRRKRVGTALRDAGLASTGDGIPYRDDRIGSLRTAEMAEVADAFFLSRRRPSPHRYL